MYDKLIAQIVSSGEKLLTFPVRSQTSVSILPHSGIPRHSNEARERNKRDSSRNEGNQIILICPYDPAIKDPKDSKKKLYLINTFFVAGCKINIQKSVTSVHVNTEQFRLQLSQK
jgi:hypothetical protein